MLLKHTNSDIKERNALTINPAKTCQPIGAMIAALGIHKCIPHSHGSQGCCSYHRSTLTRHYKEPVIAGTSSFTEGSSVFGGQANLLTSIDNLFQIYEPDVIAVHTTCLSETIGDDINQITAKAKADGKIPEGKHVIFCSTPSYVGSHITGFSNMVTGMVKYFSKSTGHKKGVINLIPGWVEPSDMREMKRILELYEQDYILFPDTSNVLDCGHSHEYSFYPKGGTKISDLEQSGDSYYTLGLGDFTSKDAVLALDGQCKVPYEILDTPIGLQATDRFMSSLSDVTGKKVPTALNEERAQLIDMIMDMQQYLYRKKVALFGDPDILFPLSEFLIDLDMIPVHIVSGTPGKLFKEKMDELFSKESYSVNVKNGPQADMYLLHQWIKNEPVDLIIGNTYGKYIARDEKIPFLRLGFPILDRIGHSYFPRVGYKGAMLLLRDILGCIMDKIDADSLEEKFELVM